MSCEISFGHKIVFDFFRSEKYFNFVRVGLELELRPFVLDSIFVHNKNEENILVVFFFSPWPCSFLI